MSIFSDIMAGIKTTLEAGITDIQVFDYPVDSPNQYPVAICIPQDIDPEIAFGGSAIEANILIKVMTNSISTEDAYHKLYNMIDPVDADESIIRAIRADRTLNGSCDDCDIISIENIGRVEYNETNPPGADFILRVIK